MVYLLSGLMREKCLFSTTFAVFWIFCVELKKSQIKSIPLSLFFVVFLFFFSRSFYFVSSTCVFRCTVDFQNSSYHMRTLFSPSCFKVTKYRWIVTSANHRQEIPTWTKRECRLPSSLDFPYTTRTPTFTRDDQHPPPSSPSKVRPRGAEVPVCTALWSMNCLMKGDTLYRWRGMCCWVSSVCLVTILHFALVQCLVFRIVCLNLVSSVHCCWLVRGRACCVTVNGLTWCIVSTFCTEVLTLPGNVIFSAACKPASDTQKKGLDNQTRCQFHCRETTL